MSMHPQPIPAIPEETARVARAVLLKGNVFLRMRDELGTLYTDEDLRDLLPSADNQLRPHGAWLWSPSCNIRRG